MRSLSSPPPILMERIRPRITSDRTAPVHPWPETAQIVERENLLAHIEASLLKQVRERVYRYRVAKPTEALRYIAAMLTLGYDAQKVDDAYAQSEALGLAWSREFSPPKHPPSRLNPLAPPFRSAGARGTMNRSPAGSQAPPPPPTPLLPTPLWPPQFEPSPPAPLPRPIGYGRPVRRE